MLWLNKWEMQVPISSLNEACVRVLYLSQNRTHRSNSILPLPLKNGVFCFPDTSRTAATSMIQFFGRQTLRFSKIRPRVSLVAGESRRSPVYLSYWG